jgi:hypothetical protein
MSSPVSSRRWFFFGEDGLEGFVFGRVVGDAVLPAVPDDVQQCQMMYSQARARMRVAWGWSLPRAVASL